ncbi:MAG: hypothetical protein QMC95_05570 [Desulfitobacteriaceae bacterium]|nr:hypothetical protein [Desulfitobacteriaceae bacterium]MDI6913670.1 hypothetical protein [Desulfitobacteriaceae bacterium]
MVENDVLFFLGKTKTPTSILTRDTGMTKAVPVLAIGAWQMPVIEEKIMEKRSPCSGTAIERRYDLP